MHYISYTAPGNIRIIYINISYKLSTKNTHDFILL